MSDKTEPRLLGTLRDDHLRVKKPIPLRWRKRELGLSWLVEAVGFGEFGHGDTQSAALYALQGNIKETYYSLQNAPELGADLERVRVLMTKHIERLTQEAGR